MPTCARCKRDVDGMHLCLPGMARYRFRDWVVPGAGLEAEETRQRWEATMEVLRNEMNERHRSLERLADREIAALMVRGVPCSDLEWVTGHPVHGLNVVPFIKHKPTGERLVSFPPTLTGPHADRHEERIVAILTPTKPPTLREWLGDRVGELGRWSDVLREQPVPAGWVREWQWSEMFVSWIAHGDTIHGPRSFTVEPSDVVSACRGDAVQPHDAYLMALFTRNPDVPPEPKPAAFPWDPYPEVI